MATETIEPGEGPGADEAGRRATRRTQVWVAIVGAVGHAVELIGQVEGELRGREADVATRRNSGSNQPRAHPCEVTAPPAGGRHRAGMNGGVTGGIPIGPVGRRPATKGEVPWFG